MDTIIQFFSNTIVLGVISSLIASIITFFVSRIIFRRKVNKEKNQRITMAKKDVMYVLRPMILERTMIPHSQLSLFLSSISKQYEINASEIYDYQSLSEDLIREIMMNPLLSTSLRVTYCEFIESFLKTKQNDELSISNEKVPEIPELDAMNRVLPYIVALFTLLGMIVGFVKDSEKSVIDEILSLGNHEYPYLLVLIPITTIMVAIAFVELFNLNKKNIYRKKHHHGNDDCTVN